MQLELEEKNLYFVEQFDFCKHIEIGDKLYRDYDNILKLHKNSYFQGVYRYIANEDKIKTLGYLKDLLHIYCSFLKKITTMKTGYLDTIRFQVLNESILYALKILNETYLHEFKELISFHKEVLNTFNAFTFFITLQNAELKE